MNTLIRNSFMFRKRVMNVSLFLAPPIAPTRIIRSSFLCSSDFACPSRRYSTRTARTTTALSSSVRRKRSKRPTDSKQYSRTKLQGTETPPDTGNENALLTFVKRKCDEGGVRKVFDSVKAAEEGTSDQNWSVPDGPVYRNAIRCLLRSERLDLALELHQVRLQARVKRPHELPSDFRLTAAVLRAIIRTSPKRSQRAEHSAQLFAQLRDDCIRLCKARSDSVPSRGRTDEQEKDVTKYDVNDEENSKAALMTSQNVEEREIDADEPLDVSARYMAIALSDAMTSLFTERDRTSSGASSKNIREGDLSRGAEALRLLKQLSRVYGESAALAVTVYNELIRLVGKAKQVTLIFNILDAMEFAGVKKDGTTFEFLANAVVRQVGFVTGAVSMDTLPPPLGAEVAFVGRSNVGKSSLVNMLVNRKALAYVSGRPGKTQQFNYFVVNERDPSSAFHLVDLPGVGYAKVPKPIQDEWKRFMIQYFRHRTSLRLVFHLVDGRHGALADDEILMSEMSKLRGAFHYVVVLTKMDKIDKQKVSRKVLDTTRNALAKCGCGSDVPIVSTSAESRLGRDEMWRHLQMGLQTLRSPISW